MQTIGERLEEARKKKGISIREAAEATKIRGDYLQKFESNHFDIGLTEIYTRGFLRTYGNYLKIPTERLLNDYAALGRGEARPRQPSREIYGRMDISVSSAGESSDRAAPPEEGAADAEPAQRAQPRYPRGKTNLPSGPDPAVIFRYAKWAGAAVVLLIIIWAASSFIGSRGNKTPATAQGTGQIPTPAAPAASTPAAPAANRATITATDIVRIQIWAYDPNMPDQHGAELVPPTTMIKGDSIPFVKTGSVRIRASAQENYILEVNGRQMKPADIPGVKGKPEIQID